MSQINRLKERTIPLFTKFINHSLSEMTLENHGTYQNSSFDTASNNFILRQFFISKILIIMFLCIIIARPMYIEWNYLLSETLY